MPGKNSRLIFGVIAAQVSDIEQRQMLNGIIEQAQANNIDIAVFSNIYNPNEYNTALYTENQIYDLILSSEIDGLILFSEAIINTELQKNILEKLKLQSHIPIVALGVPLPNFTLPDFHFINTDDARDIESITDHLIECHGYKDIDILTGHIQVAASHIRVSGYRQSLEKHGIPFNKGKVIFGDFWVNSGKSLAQSYIRGERPFPQAVVCTNDYMAYGLLDELMVSGIKIPEKVAVTGYEYIRERIYHSPLLTTFQRNRKEIGKEAVNWLISKVRNNKFEEPSPPEGVIIPGTTCGCSSDSHFINELQTAHEEKTSSFLNLFSQLEHRLTECNSIHDYVCVIKDFLFLFRNVSEIYICLFEDWNESRPQSDTINYYRVISPDKEEPQLMHKHMLSRLMSAQSDAAAYYFCPLFFSDRLMGYIVLRYNKPDSYDYTFRNLLKAAANALEFLRMKNDIRYFIQCQNISEYYDTITGLYNQKGFKKAITTALSKSQNSSNIIMICLETQLFSPETRFDMQKNNIQTAQVIAESIRQLSHNSEAICGHISEKTYAFALIGNFSENDIPMITDKLEILLVHKDIYVKRYGINSFVCSSRLYSQSEFVYETVYSSVMEEIQHKVCRLSEKRLLPYFETLLKCRNSIYMDPAASPSINEISRRLSLSEGYFRNIYKKYFGVSYHQDCIISRISLAKYLLCTTSMSITEISSLCGYSDPKYFMRIFQSNVGQTINRYRTFFNIF
ncbi:MAG: substrate-binding domain-containing protein [Porcipelethomonas sp.]